MTAEADFVGEVVPGPWAQTPAQTGAQKAMNGPLAGLAAEPLRLPAWTSDRAVRRAQARHGARVAARIATRSTWLGPAAVLRGTWRAGRFWWQWVQADDIATELRDERGKLGKEIFVVREHRRIRWILTGAGAGASTVGEIIAAVAVGEWVPALSGVVVLGGTGLAGRRRLSGPGDLPGIEPDIHRDLAPEHLNGAFRAAGLLKGETALILCAPIVRDRNGRGWETVLDLPRGGGKTAADAIGKLPTIAAELGVDEIQLIMSRVRAHQGGHGRRLSLWVCDDDPYLGAPTPSLLIDVERFDFWKAVPFGQDARGNRVDLALIWQSAFFGGLPRRGKTFSMRLLVAAAVLDPWCQLWIVDGKGGADFRPATQVAHRTVFGADPDDLVAFEQMLDELIVEMSRRFAFLATLPPAVCPEGKLTPEIMRRYNLPLILLVIDELQELFEACEEDKDRQRLIGKLARIARRGPAAGFIPIYASQRPDAKSVPTKIREIVTFRYATQVTDRTSSDMVLGDGKARAGADASLLSEEHKGVGVLVTGPASFVTVKADLLTNPEFDVVCQRGRALRLNEGTLTGAACGDLPAAASSVGYVIPEIIGDVLEAFGQRARMWTDDVLTELRNIDEEIYGDWDGSRLAAELEDAGVTRTRKQVKIDGENRAGWYRSDVEGAIPPDVLAARPVEGRPVESSGPVEGAPATSSTARTTPAPEPHEVPM